MSRKSAAAEQPESSDPTDAAPPRPVMKSQAMDAALAAGMAAPAEAVAYVQEHFGIEISAKQFSTHKSLVKQKASIDARHKGPRPEVAPKSEIAPKPAPRPPVAAPARGPAREGPPEVADAVQAIKGLVETLGVEQVKRIAGLFGA